MLRADRWEDSAEGAEVVGISTTRSSRTQVTENAALPLRLLATRRQSYRAPPGVAHGCRSLGARSISDDDEGASLPQGRPSPLSGPKTRRDIAASARARMARGLERAPLAGGVC